VHVAVQFAGDPGSDRLELRQESTISRFGRSLGVAVLIALSVGLYFWVGAAETLAILAGFALLSATAFLGPRSVRVTGSALAAFVLFAIVRAMATPLAGVFAGLVGGALLLRFAPVPVLRRVTFLLPSLVLLVFVTTLLMYNAPGNPFANEKAASPEVVAALREHFGVPETALEFFGVYMQRLLIDGSLGPSIRVQGRTVEALLAPALPVSITLGILALVIAAGIGLVLGVRAGLKPNSAADYSSMGLAMVGLSLPNFVIGAMFVIVFALKLGWLPVAGWGGYRELLMPAFTLALPYAAYIARLARSGTIEIMQQDFIRTARAKGVPESAIVLRHALRGAIVPVVSFLGPAAAGIMTGSFVVETLFGVPGMGQWFVKGAVNRDYSLVLGTALVYASLVTSFNLVVDLAYAFLDPRVRSQL
jgi:oligopeptide transport system permease protein